MSFKFKFEQIALSIDPSRRQRALNLLADLGITEWHEDEVVATGTVGEPEIRQNTAHLAFNYQATSDKPLELELLEYTQGVNFVSEAKVKHGAQAIATHIGMHVTEEQLENEVRPIFERFMIGTSQEVKTDSHTNPAIKDSRRYQYTIFATRDLLGIDLKFIVRLPYNGGDAEADLTPKSA